MKRRREDSEEETATPLCDLPSEMRGEIRGWLRGVDRHRLRQTCRTLASEDTTTLLDSHVAKLALFHDKAPEAFADFCVFYRAVSKMSLPSPAELYSTWSDDDPTVPSPLRLTTFRPRPHVRLVWWWPGRGSPMNPPRYYAFLFESEFPGCWSVWRHHVEDIYFSCCDGEVFVNNDFKLFFTTRQDLFES